MGIDLQVRKRRVAPMNPAQKQFSLNRGASRKQIPISACAIGSVVTETQAEENKWKKKMLVAGLGPRGLSFPKDWDTLSEDEKTKRLDAVLKCLD